MSPDDTLATWIDETYRVTALYTGVEAPTTFDGGIPMPGEAAGSLDVVLGSDCGAGDCTVLGGDYATTTTEVDLGGSHPLAMTQPLRAVAVSPDGGTWAVTFPPGEDEQFGCSGIYDPVEGRCSPRSCDATLTSFSPDGTYLTSARGDNQMSGSVEVLDEDLEVVLSFSPRRGASSRATAGPTRTTCSSSSPPSTPRSGHCSGCRPTGARRRSSPARNPARTRGGDAVPGVQLRRASSALCHDAAVAQDGAPTNQNSRAAIGVFVAVATVATIPLSVGATIFGLIIACYDDYDSTLCSSATGNWVAVAAIACRSC